MRIRDQYVQQVANAFPVTPVVNILPDKVPGFFFGFSADNVGLAKYLHLPAVLLSGQTSSVIRYGAQGLHILRDNEVEIGVRGRELLPPAAIARAHQCRPGALQRFWFGVAAGGVEVWPRVVEFTIRCPQLLAKRYPVIGDVVALIMRFLRLAKHGDLSLIPACDNVQAETSTGNMIDGGDFLGSPDRVNCRDMKRGKDTDFFCCGGQPGRPGEGFEISMIKIYGSAHAFPARYRNDRFDTRLVGQLS